MGLFKCKTGPGPSPEHRAIISPKIQREPSTPENEEERIQNRGEEIMSQAIIPLNSMSFRTFESWEENRSSSELLLAINPGAYDKYAAKHLSAISGWSYSTSETFKDMISEEHGIGHRNADFVEVSVKNDPMLVESTAQIIRTEDRKVIIVSFRGTEMTNWVNWLTDATTKKMKFHGCSVHGGFLRNFKEVWYGTKGVLAHLLNPSMLSKDYNYGDANDSTITQQGDLEAVYITGHSLGGAMATLAGLAMSYEERSDADVFLLFQKLRGVYTYGAPMVVSKTDRNYCENLVGNLIFRHVYKHDIIPHLPPLTSGSFDHIGREYRYHSKRKGGWTELVESSGALLSLFGGQRRSEQIVSILLVTPFVFADLVIDNNEWIVPYFKMPWSILDHSPIGYIDSLWEELGEETNIGT